MRVFRIGVIALVLVGSIKAGPEPFDHSTWDHLLREVVNSIGEVDYSRLKANPELLNRYVKQLEAASPKTAPTQFPTRNHEIAYWINAYNALMVNKIVTNYPVGGVDAFGLFRAVFKQEEHNSGGEIVSLGYIEHELLRKVYDEPRIHFALVCASVSCPALAREAMEGETLDSQLDRLAEDFVSQDRNVTIDVANRRITLSKLFDWYGRDFERPTGLSGNAAVLGYIGRYLDGERGQLFNKLGPNPRVSFHGYDWALNDVGPRSRSKNQLEREFARSQVSTLPTSPPGLD